jgi:hypothetical protein
MANISITIRDSVVDKILQEFGSLEEWKRWVKDQTRNRIVENRKRAAYEQRMSQFEEDVNKIESDTDA